MPPKTSRAPRPLTHEDIAAVLGMAAENWVDWQDVYGHQGPVGTNPLLTSRIHLGCFVWVHNLGRVLPWAKAKQLQQALRQDTELHAALEAGDAEALEQLAGSYSRVYSAKGTAGGLRSFMSRLAAFCNPSAFMAYDRFASSGLGLLLGASGTGWERGLRAYEAAALGLARQEAIWPEGSLGTIGAKADAIGAERFAFRLRVLDGACMRLGRQKLEKPPALAVPTATV